MGEKGKKEKGRGGHGGKENMDKEIGMFSYLSPPRAFSNQEQMSWLKQSWVLWEV